MSKDPYKTSNSSKVSRRPFQGTFEEGWCRFCREKEEIILSAVLRLGHFSKVVVLHCVLESPRLYYKGFSEIPAALCLKVLPNYLTYLMH